MQVPLVILADPAYPLLPWLLKPYTGRNLTPEKESFNAYLSSVRILVENSFGKLNARWRMIGKKIDARIDLAPQIIATCCALHNICERDNTPLTDEWRTGSNPPIRQSGHPQSRPGQTTNTAIPSSGADVRNALTSYIATNLPLRASARQEP